MGNNNPPAPNVPGIPLPTEPITVVITYDPSTGGMQVQGPIGHRTLIYGILVSAMETVLKHGLDQGKRGGGIVIPRPRIFGG